MSKVFRLGVFILLTLLILLLGVFWIGSRQYLFTSTYRVYAYFQNVAGLIEGADVRVGGLHKGTVKSIDLPHSPDQKVRVVMNLEGQTRDVVKKDSVAAIKTEGLVGDKYVEISFGSDQAEKAGNGDTLQTQAPLDISELIKKTNAILDSAQGAVQNITVTAGNLQAVSSKINKGSGTVGALINDKTVYQRVNQGATAFQEDMEALKHNFLVRGFFHKRGYEDTADLTKHEIAQLPSKPYEKEFTYDAAKLFDKPETAKLKKGKLLNDAGRYLEEKPFGLAVVAAYLDKGDTDKVQVLSEARAMVVREYLAQNFKLDDARIKTIGLGKSVNGQNGSGVEILVYPSGTQAATSAPQPKK